MSYSIDEGVEEARKRLADLEVIAERFPDATMTGLPDGRQVWCSSSIEPTDFLLVRAKDSVVLCPYELVGGTAVFIAPPGWEDASVFFRSIARQDTVLHKQLLARFGG